ncbi:MAG: primosomal protein N' (replication factor Y) (superfamily II helicase) [bacterium P3]|nr:MAG: primosomal protein N' (replication factor Y) (superfamily II helicase) [bacterium P3]KWW42051.1 MAG: primosomal protein N' (replication factor Y) (superfamily II helicase) [bacterium F083]
MNTYFADVILPLPLPGTYTYRVPQEYNGRLYVGARVVVQFGSKKIYSAIVRRIHEEVPDHSVKYILGILDQTPLVDERQLRFWEWLAEYYMCHIGDVMAVALPAAFRLASETILTIHPDFSGALDELSAHEQAVVQLLAEHPVMTPDDIAKALGFAKVMPIVSGMVERGIVVLHEELHERVAPRTVSWIVLDERYRDEQQCKQLFDQLEKDSRSHKQLALMLRYMQMSHFGQQAVRKRDLLQTESSPSSLNTLLKRGVFILEERVESRLEEPGDSLQKSVDGIELNDEQQAAYDYCRCSGASAVTLLHGVTSSGKTEVYIRLIADTLAAGRQALFLLPEIALTTQLINRLRRYFGDRVGVYHSRFSISQRAEVWSRTAADADNRYNVLIGARSAIFLPFRDLDLVIVDEEHDSSFKQFDPAPRYHGRDAAIYLARLHNARTVLGSATPSIESSFNARNGKYGYVTMKHRYGGGPMPEVLCVDMREASRKKELHGHFSQVLVDHITEALADGHQAILFQNRRGFSPRLECDDCHHIPQCRNCDVSLVYHKATNSLRCHYCGYSIPIPAECPACHSTHLTMKGFGTERVEEDLAILFPDARVARMDLDSTIQKNRHAQLLSDFEERRIDILVGTQMVTKGLDFSHVSIVGILSADSLVSYPDFRAFERAFQQMMQVSGRAGRREDRGKVIIQAYNPWHQAIRNVIDNDYDAMYSSQINERRVFRYPPFCRIIDITLRHRDAEVLNGAAATFAAHLRQHFAGRVVGPEYPNVPRIRSLYLKKIMLRFDRNEPIAQAKGVILRLGEELRADKGYASVMIHYDVDPQ